MKFLGNGSRPVEGPNGLVLAYRMKLFPDTGHIMDSTSDLDAILDLIPGMERMAADRDRWLVDELQR
jgi:hypothetical protein